MPRQGKDIPSLRKIFSKGLTGQKPMYIIGKEEREKVMNLVLIMVGNKYKVYREMENGKRRLMGTFKSSQDAIRFMNG